MKMHMCVRARADRTVLRNGRSMLSILIFRSTTRFFVGPMCDLSQHIWGQLWFEAHVMQFELRNLTLVKHASSTKLPMNFATNHLGLSRVGLANASYKMCRRIGTAAKLATECTPVP